MPQESYFDNGCVASARKVVTLTTEIAELTTIITQIFELVNNSFRRTPDSECSKASPQLQPNSIIDELASRIQDQTGRLSVIRELLSIELTKL